MGRTFWCYTYSSVLMYKLLNNQQGLILYVDAFDMFLAVRCEMVFGRKCCDTFQYSVYFFLINKIFMFYRQCWFGNCMRQILQSVLSQHYWSWYWMPPFLFQSFISSWFWCFCFSNTVLFFSGDSDIIKTLPGEL